jgi:carboxymethylenebutenolidase
MSETKVDVKAADGTAEGFLFTPSSGTGPWPGVVYLTDIMGVRPAYHALAQRLADQGFVVVMPNVFYRGTKLPVLDFVPQMGEERTMKRMGELFQSLPADKMGPDGAAYADWLLAQKNVKPGKVGVVGYCFTGSMTMRTAAEAPQKIAAAISFHGGGLYTDQPNSPHKLLPKIKGSVYAGHAKEDRSMSAEAIVKFEAALKEWGGKGGSETYDALHGWCIPGRPEIYKESEAERAFAKMVSVLKAALG